MGKTSADAGAKAPPAAPRGGPVKVGLEIHQQLSTGKLFCRCPSELEETVAGTFVRRLRATKSEMGEVDQAALAETRKGKAFRYQMTPSNTCLVDADEEPPHVMNRDALSVALTMAALSRMDIVDEIQVMRKIVVDGSNTTGFQRTALVAGGGMIPMPGGSGFRLESLCIEEDSAREIDESDSELVYRLDRLGIPLIEIATAPDITSGEEAREVAARIGALLRATKRVKRGLGTIRQDINVSVDGGARVELKGVQDLRSIPEVVDEEARRQRALNRAGQLLLSNGVSPGRQTYTPHDLTAMLAATKAKVVRQALDSGGRVWGLKLAGFAATLGESLSKAPGKRVLGPEFSQRARVFGLGGTIHNEEGDLTAKYGFTPVEVEAVAKALEVGASDCFLLAAGPADELAKAFASIAERAKLAGFGVTSEVRAVNDDATTRYLRPMPGAARMYPETDVPPIGVAGPLLENVRRSLPPLPEARLGALVRRTGIAPALAEQLVQTDNLDHFEEVAVDEKSAGAPDSALAIQVNAALARLLLKELADDERGGLIDWPRAKAIIEAVRGELLAARLSKEALPTVWLAVVRDGKSPEAAIKAASGTDLQEARRLVRVIVEGKEALVLDKGEASHAPLMGIAMKELRGKVDGKVVADLLREEIARLLAKSPG